MLERSPVLEALAPGCACVNVVSVSSPAVTLSRSKEGDDVFVLLASHERMLYVLKNETIVWGAHLDMVPVALRTGTFG